MKNKYVKRAHISEREFRMLLKCFAGDLPALVTSRLLGMNYRTAHRFYSLLRNRILHDSLEQQAAFAGEIEVDESYFGARRVRGKRGRGASGKIPVLGLHKRGSLVFVSIVKNCSRQALMPVLKGRILSQSDVYTDGWKAYDGLVRDGFRHHRIHHHANEFARGKNHVNGIESFWSYAKGRLAKFHGIGNEAFPLHLKECEWRWNHRGRNIYKLLLANLRKYPL